MGSRKTVLENPHSGIHNPHTCFQDDKNNFNREKFEVFKKQVILN